ncbi:MAG: deoxycytidylate deaminase [Proteobacteria bacterium]|nr:deoxycytidylate deaminase [Pseudomonadota bacterium]NBP13006.1 deoxycytidylate deaminase [bacterium]
MEKKPTRLTWEEYALKIAEVTALRSEDPYMKVGSCVLNSDNRIIGVGYNGLAAGKHVTDEFWSDRDQRRKYMIHAEANALSLVDRGQGVLLACTLLPCSSCATLIAGHGISKVVYRETYKRDESALEIFDFYGIKCEQHLWAWS